MPVGISSTARLTAAKSISSGISSSLYTGMGLLASIARARNDSLLIVAYLRQRMDASAEKRWQKRPKCLLNAHIFFQQHIFDDVLCGYLSRDENYALGRSADARFAATCNASFRSIMADRVTINISQRAVRCAICRLRPLHGVDSSRSSLTISFAVSAFVSGAFSHINFPVFLPYSMRFAFGHCFGFRRYFGLNGYFVRIYSTNGSVIIFVRAPKSVLSRCLPVCIV